MNENTGNQVEEISNQHHRNRTSLWVRITLATTITASIAAIAVGYFSFIRNSATQTLLGNQFQRATQEKAVSQIQARVAQEALEINKFFLNIDESVISTSAYAANLLSQEVPFADTAYWEANNQLSRLPSGSWDNSENDLAAIFAPNTFELTNQTVKVANALSHLDFIVPYLVDSNPDIIALYFGNYSGYIYYYPNIDLANLIPPDFDPSQRPWFTKSENSLYRNSKVNWSEPYNDAAQHGLVVTSSIPVYDKNENFHGVIGADVKLETITNRVLNIRIGETGYAFLSDTFGNIIAMPELGYQKFGIPPEKYLAGEEPQLASLKQGPIYLQPVFNGMARYVTGFARAKLQGEVHYFAFSPISTTGYSLAIIVPASEMETAYLESQELVAKENQATTRFWLVLLVIVGFAATIVSLGVSQVLTNPLNRLTETAQQVMAGNLIARAPESSVDEVNMLARTFNAMTSQLREMLGSLEERVAERTAELETATQQSQRRAAQFEAIAQVARSISASQDLDSLLPNITDVISRQFGFYHVGIFLLDADREFAVLRASNSPGGKKMLARNHQLKVGETGIVGFVTGQGQPRIALDTGIDAIYFDNPDLPGTRSEIALPMFIGNQIIGALDVQSVEPNAFSNEDVNTLATLADQVSIAIQNAHLYEETHKALTQSQTLLQKFTKEGWSQFTHTQKLIGIQRSKAGATLLRNRHALGEFDGNGTLDLPINLRGQKIGSLKVRATDNHKWTQDEVDIATAIIERAAIAMENARLLDEAQRRATRERVISDISANISAFSDMDGILRTAVQQLGRSLGGAEIELELGVEATSEEKTVSD